MLLQELHSKNILSGTGPRSLVTAKPEVKKTFFAALLEVIEAYDPDGIMSGMAQGFDAALAQAAATLKKPLIAMVPTPSYGEYYWGTKGSVDGVDRRTTFNELIKYANGSGGLVHYVTTDAHRGGKANYMRNERLVQYGKKFIVHNPKGKGGTQDCVNRIIKAKIPYVTIDIEGKTEEHYEHI